MKNEVKGNVWHQAEIAARKGGCDNEESAVSKLPAGLISELIHELL
jgi:hypothetical protein